MNISVWNQPKKWWERRIGWYIRLEQWKQKVNLVKKVSKDKIMKQ
ncbi:MAG: hypothetical protein PWP53_985 [Lacrimispora sp.]|nr:hypothetical protein [Lacrimispora sp.]